MNASKTMANNLKKYSVSLACMVPHNFECSVEAENKLDAFKKGRERFDDGVDGMIVMSRPIEFMLDLSDEDAENRIPIGAYVEEAK